jgi:hypothetical protein
MKSLRRVFYFEEMERLAQEIGENCGIPDGKTELNEAKVIEKGTGQPGCMVKIYWTKEAFGYIDTGYIFTLPGEDADDIYMSGIVHIPVPSGGEKGCPEPEWHSLAALSQNPLIKKIVVY